MIGPTIDLINKIDHLTSVRDATDVGTTDDAPPRASSARPETAHKRPLWQEGRE